MKRISIIIIVAMVMQLFSGLAPVFTEDGPTQVFAEGTIVYTYNLGPAGSETDVTGTLYSDGKLVIEGAGPIPDWSFYQNTSIKEVVIEGGITSIGQYAFQGCTSLTSVTISDTVKYISGYAFYSCISLESVVIGEGVANIYSSAFTECSALSTITNHFKGNQNLLNDPFKNAGSSSGTKTAYAYAANTKFTSAAETAGYTIVYLDTYTVSFNSNGGIAVDDITGVSHGSKITAPAPAPTKPGYTFAGWYKESALTNAWDFDTDTVTQDITLYAGWTAIDYSADYEIIGDPAIYMLSGNVLTIGAGASGSTITIKGTMTEETIAIANGVTNLTLILDGVSITSTGNPPIDLQGNAEVTVELADGTTNILNASGAAGKAGLHVPKDALLTVTGTGYLTVTSGLNGAAIGGNQNGDSGTITIDNGAITATGNNAGAGIGGGQNGSAGPITINGGIVTATGNNAGAGIGGGQNGSAGSITINGGTVTATGAAATGIGGNQKGSDKITINGGIINVMGGFNGSAAMGGAYGANGGEIILNGGTINAICLGTGSGIGSGDGAASAIISIGESASVTAVTNGENKSAIDASSTSSGIAINVQLEEAISKIYKVYIKMGSRVLTLPTNYKKFAFSATSGSEISVYFDKDCTNLIGRIITTAEGYTIIPVTALGTDPTNVTLVRFQTLLSDSRVAISGIDATYDYTGSPLAPEPTVKFGAVALIKDTDYTLSYSNNTDVGTAKITLNFIGKYYGTAEKTFTIELNQYTVTFKDWNGSVIETQTVNHGSNATAPADPSRTGYTFADWDAAFTNVTSDLTVTATYAINQYTITFDSNGGSVVASITQNYDSDITAPDNPNKTGYTFNNWTPALPAKMPAESKTHTAQWAADTYNITYNLDGGTNNGANPANYTIETATITLQNPIKTGYTFDGWYDAEIDGNGVTHIISGSTGHKTLYARWTLNQYTVTFKDHDGDTLKTETVNHGSDATAPADLSRTGYTFADWDAAFTNVTSDLTVTATYAINQYTITFDSNGGSVVASITQNYDSDITAPDNPNKTGYTFNNWTPALPAKMPAESKTHTAQWAADTYNITYNLGGGINSDVNPAAYDIVTPTIILQLPTKTGYNFAGWWSTPFGGTQVAQIASGSTGDIILYALWTPKHNTAYKVEHYQQDVSGASYTIKDTDNLAGATAATATAFARIYTGFTENTAHGSRVASGTIAGDGTLVLKLYYDRSTYDVSFNSNGGSAVYDTTGVRHGATISAPVAPTKTGYTFAGWYKDSGLTTEWDFALDTVTANTTLYAKWTGNAYNVTFDGNYGGDLSTSNKSVPYGDIYGELATVSRTGYTFNGWFTEASGGTKIETGTTVNTANDHTLYAQWTINTYNITYNLDGGTNDAENVSIYTIETATISLKDATKTGYSFDGWYDADIDGNEVTHIILGSTGHKTLYARWTINQYTVTYKDHDGTILKTETVNHGSNATAPDDPTRTGYIFAGWDAAFTNVTSDLIVTATYSINQYTLTYTAGANGAITGFATQTVDHGADGTEVTAVPDGGYHFVKWSDDSTINPRIDTNITVDISIEAVFDRNSSSGRPTPLAPSAGTGMDILVNGKTETGATASTTTEGNQTVTTVVLDDQKVEEKLKKEGNNSVVTIPVDTGANVVVGALNGQTVKNMEDKESVLEIKTGQVTYTLPASQINITSVSEEIGTRVELKDIAVSVKISEPAPDTVQIVEDTADKNNYQIVVKPIEFEITCSSGGKTVGVSRFNAYVERLIAIPDGVDPSKVTTGVILNSDGTFSHVPTVITIIDGKYYAKINSLTNSVYSVVYSPKTFKDVENHWAKEAVNDMGSRLVISGVGNDNFEPDRGISRAEFAAIIVRALGLMNPGTGEDAFKDVAGNTWYYDAVSIAFKYGIISGYTNNKFGPHDKITREQAMTIVANAMKITDLDAGLTDREVVKVLARFTDTKNVAGYAKEPIAACIKTGIVSGKGNDIVAPKAPITRAEVALIVRMLLQKSNMIN